jgi:hypothetical protein
LFATPLSYSHIPEKGFATDGDGVPIRTLLPTDKEFDVADTPLMYCTALEDGLYTMKGWAAPVFGNTGDT